VKEVLKRHRDSGESAQLQPLLDAPERCSRFWTSFNVGMTRDSVGRSLLVA
jgi:hypothetical protein